MLIPIAQEVFAAQTTQRSARIVLLRDNWRAVNRSVPRICLVAPSHFHLWEEGGQVLAEAFSQTAAGECELVRFDNDDFTSAAPLALAEAVQDCDAIVSLNVSRADLAEILPREIPWITWLFGNRSPVQITRGHGMRCW